MNAVTKFNVRNYFRHVYLFEGLSAESIDSLAKGSFIKRYKKNSLLFQQGDQADAFYIIINGRVCIFCLSSKGDEQVIHIHDDGDIVAEAAIFANHQYPASCRTLKESLVVRVSKDAFISMIEKNPANALKIMASYSKRLREFVTLVEYLSLESVEQRMMKYFDRHQIKEGGRSIVRLAITKKEWANLLGTIAETLSRNLKRLKLRGIIEEDKGCFIIKKEGVGRES